MNLGMFVVYKSSLLKGVALIFSKEVFVKARRFTQEPQAGPARIQ